MPEQVCRRNSDITSKLMWALVAAASSACGCQIVCSQPKSLQHTWCRSRASLVVSHQIPGLARALLIIIASHKQGKGYKKIAKALTVPRDTAGKYSSQVQSYRSPGYTACMWQKEELSPTTTRFMRRQVVKNPQVTEKDLQQDIVAAGTKVFICTVRSILNAEGLHARNPRRTRLLTQKHKKSFNMLKTI